MHAAFIERRAALRRLARLAAGTVTGRLAAGAAAGLPAAGAIAQTAFPSKPITIVVPYTAGGPTDLTARRVAELLGRFIGANVVVENRPGAATLIAAESVARAPKDGHTLLFAPGTTTSSNPYLFRKLPYRLEDFAPVSLVSRQPFVLTASDQLNVKTVAQLVDYARGRPAGINFGTTGVGSLTHIIGKWIGRTLQIEMQDVPYKGTSAALGDLLGGRLDTQVEGIVSAIPLHRSGKARVLAVMGEERSPSLPDVPTFREAGYPELVASIWFGLLAPAGTPEDIVEKLRRAVADVVALPEYRDRLAEQGEVAVSSASRSQYAEHLQREYEAWGRIIRPLNLPPQ